MVDIVAACLVSAGVGQECYWRWGGLESLGPECWGERR